MKVSELIAKLRLADPDAPVCVYRGDKPEPFVAIIIKQEKSENPLNQARCREKFTDRGDKTAE